MRIEMQIMRIIAKKGGEVFMFLRRLKKYLLFFVLGALGYAAMETIWRGYTHWSMALAGGIGFIIFSLVAEGFRESPLLLKAVLCAVGVTLVELVFGLIFNVTLGMNVWDYSHLPLNLFGQICPWFSLLWVGIAAVFLPFADALNEGL